MLAEYQAVRVRDIRRARTELVVREELNPTEMLGNGGGFMLGGSLKGISKGLDGAARQKNGDR